MLLIFIGAQNAGRPQVALFQLPENDYNIDDDAAVTIRRVDGETGGYAGSFSENITFYGSAYELIRAELIEAPGARENVIDVEIYDDCCSSETPTLLFRGKISATDIEWCEITDGKEASCEFTATPEAADWTNEQELCVRSKLITQRHRWPNGTEFWYLRHPYVRYCNEVRPSALQVIIFIFGGLLGFISFVVFLVVDIILGIINAILSALNSIANIVGAGDFIPDPIDLDPNEDGANGLIKTVLQNDFNEFISNCGHGHPAPFIRQYIENVCFQCGLSGGFQSSILNNVNSPYYNAVLFHAPNKEGNRDEFYDNNGNVVIGTADNYFNLNAPNKTGGEFLDELSILFNSEWYIENDALYFESENINTTQWIDFTIQENRQDIIELCYEYGDDRPPRGLALSYALDGFDGVGNEGRFLYKDIIPFDNPPNPALGPLERIEFPFGVPRFRDDEIDPDKISRWKGFFDVINLITIGVIEIDKPEFERTMLLERGATSIPKILVLEDDYNPNNARVINQKRPASDLPWASREAIVYNWPMWIAAAHYGGQYINSDPVNTRKFTGLPNLFERWQSRDPRFNGDTRRGVSFNMELKKRCETYAPLLSLIENRNLRLSITIPYRGETVTGFINEIEIGKNTYRISGSL